MIESPPRDWRDLQVRVATILNETGLIAEIEKRITTVRGAITIDVHATDSNNIPPSLYLCECKHWQNAVPQAEVMSFRTVVGDAGAHFGLFISSAGFQAGAHAVVAHTNIRLLDWGEFQNLFVERWCRRYWIPQFKKAADRLAGSVEPLVSDASRRAHDGERLSPAEAVGILALDMWGPPFFPVARFGEGAPEPVSAAIWDRRDALRAYLPSDAANASSLRGLLDALMRFSTYWVAERDQP